MQPTLKRHNMWLQTTRTGKTMNSFFKALLISSALVSANASARVVNVPTPVSSVTVYEYTVENGLGFNLRVDAGSEPLFAFAVGVVADDSISYSLTTPSDWTGTIGDSEDWGSLSRDTTAPFYGTSWATFLAYDPASAGDINAFVLFETSSPVSATDGLITGFGVIGQNLQLQSPYMSAHSDSITGGAVTHGTGVPEPASIALMSLGLLGLVGFRKKR